jgi:hypothetical protein
MICTGFGASDTHALILNDGRQNPHPSAGHPYTTISLENIIGQVIEPVSVPKEQGQWIIPSSYHQYDARSHEAQRTHGHYSLLCVDIDQGNPSLEQVSATVDQAIGEQNWRVIYSTASSTETNRKWRVLIALGEYLTGEEYGAYQAALFDGLEHLGLRMDRTLERAGQLVFLPNRGAYYQHLIAGTALLNPRHHPMAKRAQEYIEVTRYALQNYTGQDRQEGMRSPLRAFRKKHSIAEILLAYGYEQRGASDHYRSPYQTSGGYATQDRGDHWISLSHSDADAGLGRPTPNGSRYGDAFDIYVHFQCGGNTETAMVYARQCLAEEDEARYGEATAAHGRETYENLQMIGSQLGPAGQKAALEEAAVKVEALKGTLPTSTPDENDWDIPWPPGIAGNIAYYIYSTSARPVKQFSIGMALYMLAAIGGRKYNVEGFGINLFLQIVADSGRGKGEARRGVMRLANELGYLTQDAPGIMDVFGNDMPASAAGLRKMFDENNGTRAVYREDADALVESLTQTQPGSNGDLLRAGLSNFWDQSGAGSIMGAVRYSKDENSTVAVSSPSLTLGWDYQTAPFARYLGHPVVVTSGIGARFIYVTRYGSRMKTSKGVSRPAPEPAMMEYLKALWGNIRAHAHTVIDVTWEAEARALFEKMDDETIDRMDAGREFDDILNRAHLNSAKVAACLAVGQNPHAPRITVELFQWAQAFVMKGYNECIRLASAGEVGGGERVRVGKAIKAISDYVNMSPGKRHTSYKVPKTLDTLDDVICEKFFLERLQKLADFKGSDLGLTSEDIVRKTLREMVQQEYLIPVTRTEVMQQKKVLISARLSQPLYMLGPAL